VDFLSAFLVLGFQFFVPGPSNLCNLCNLWILRSAFVVPRSSFLVRAICVICAICGFPLRVLGSWFQVLCFSSEPSVLIRGCFSPWFCILVAEFRSLRAMNLCNLCNLWILRSAFLVARPSFFVPGPSNLCNLCNLWMVLAASLVLGPSFFVPGPGNLCNLCNLWILRSAFLVARSSFFVPGPGNLCNLCNLWMVLAAFLVGLAGPAASAPTTACRTSASRPTGHSRTGSAPICESASSPKPVPISV
jgi:hypothetical protein